MISLFTPTFDVIRLRISVNRQLDRRPRQNTTLQYRPKLRYLITAS